MADGGSATWGEATAAARHRLLMASTSADETALYTTGDTIAPIGKTDPGSEGVAQGVKIGFELWGSKSPTVCVASAATTRGAEVAPVAAGKVKDAGVGDIVIGRFAKAAGADNDEVPVYPAPSYIKAS